MDGGGRFGSEDELCSRFRLIRLIAYGAARWLLVLRSGGRRGEMFCYKELLVGGERLNCGFWSLGWKSRTMRRVGEGWREGEAGRWFGGV